MNNFLQIKAAIAVISNVRGLPSASDFQKNGPFTDLFDFLQWSFGFQVQLLVHFPLCAWCTSLVFFGILYRKILQT